MNTKKNADGSLVAAGSDRRDQKNQRSEGVATTNPRLPNSQKVYVSGELHPEIKVPFREISLAPTKTMNGEIEINKPVRVYDTSGPWGDPDVDLDVTRGLPPLRAKWIRDRGDVEEIDGRAVSPQDDGYLSEKHAADRNGNSEFGIRSAEFERKPLRASANHPVTQLWYARQGIITPEMEFIAIREQMRNAECGVRSEEMRSAPKNFEFRISNSEFARNDLAHQHRGASFGANIPDRYNP